MLTRSFFLHRRAFLRYTKDMKKVALVFLCLSFFFSCSLGKSSIEKVYLENKTLHAVFFTLDGFSYEMNAHEVKIAYVAYYSLPCIDTTKSGKATWERIAHSSEHENYTYIFFYDDN